MNNELETSIDIREIQKDLRNNSLHELYDNYVDGMYIAILNENGKILIHIENDDGTTNNVYYSKEEFLEFDDDKFSKVLDELNFYAYEL